MIDLDKVLANRAATAAPPPPDLAARIEAGHRRQRRTRTVTAAFAAVVLLAGGSWLLVRPQSAHRETPATPPGAFTIPDPDAAPAPITTVWPGALTGPQEPSGTPSGARMSVVDRLDGRHLLVADTAGAISAYDVAAGTFRTLVADSGSRAPDRTGRFARTPNWLVWIAGDPYPKRSFSVFKAPVTGGERRLVGTVADGPESVTMFATDDNIYFNDDNVDADEVHRPARRMSLADGTVTVIPGSDRFLIDGAAAWAVATPGRAAGSTAVFHHLVTGETRPLVESPDADASQCRPDFCLVRVDQAWFVQRPDGSGRTALPWAGSYDLAGRLIVLPDNSLLDPLTGRHGIAEPGGGQGCKPEYGALKEQTYVRWAAAAGGGCGPRQVVFIGPGD